jgi:hypothetical protein
MEYLNNNQGRMSHFLPTTQPNFYSVRPAPAKAIIMATDNDLPAPDSRYPIYPYQAADGRFGTDYMPHCTRNVPAGLQFGTKQWMMHNAEQIINISRQRMSDVTGAGLGRASTVPPPAFKVACGVDSCFRKEAAGLGGIGEERMWAAAPDLFGTFTVKPTLAGELDMRKNIALTTKFEGGRNTPSAVKTQFDSEHIAGGRLALDG